MGKRWGLLTDEEMRIRIKGSTRQNIHQAINASIKSGDVETTERLRTALEHVKEERYVQRSKPEHIDARNRKVTKLSKAAQAHADFLTFESRYVEGYEGLYSVTPCGKIWSHVSQAWLRGGLTLAGQGYKYVNLSFPDTKAKSWLVHRLVAAAFVPNPEGKPCVNHIDGDAKNNAACNLEWVTYKENTVHAFKLGLIKLGTSRKHAVLTEEAVRRILQLKALGKTCNEVAAATGVSYSLVYNIFKGQTWKHVTL